LDVIFFPVHDRRFVAADEGRDVDLAKINVEAPFADCLTDGLGIGRIPLLG
jgi:hypothetical protein